MGKSFSTPSQLISQRVKLIQSLASNLTEDGNFKVRIQSVNSLLNLNSFELFLKENAEDDEFEEVRGRVRLAIEKVRVEEEGGTISKEREHHNQLVEKVSNFLKKNVFFLPLIRLFSPSNSFINVTII